MRHIALSLALLFFTASAHGNDTPPTFTIENTIEIRADIEAVFAFAANPLNDGKWRLEVNDMEAFGPWEVGTSYLEDARLGLTPHYLTETILVELDPPYTMVVETPEGDLYLRATRSFEETDDGGTVMTYRLDVDKRMPADAAGFRIPQFFVEFYYNHAMRGYLWKLKNILENEEQQSAQ